MERFCAALLLAAVLSGVSLSSHAGSVTAPFKMDAGVREVVGAPLCFDLDERMIVALAFFDDDGATQSLSVILRDARVGDEPAGGLFAGLLHACHCTPGGGPCRSDCARAASSWPARAGLASRLATATGPSFNVTLPNVPAHTTVAWRGNGWVDASRLRSETSLTFTPDSPAVSLPKSFLLGMVGLLALVALRWRMFSR